VKGKLIFQHLVVMPKTRWFLKGQLFFFSKKSKQPSCIFLFRNSCCQFRIESDGSQQLFEWGITPLFLMLLK